MRRTVVFFLLFMFSVVLEMSFRHLPTPGVKIDLVFLLVVYLGFKGSFWPGGLGVLLMGLAMESLSVSYRGTLSLSYLCVFFLIRMIEGRLFVESRSSQALWVFLLALVHKGVEMILLGGHGFSPSFFLLFLLAALEGVAALVIFPLLDRLDGVLQGERGD